MPTRELILQWVTKNTKEDRYDSELQPIGITIEGLDLTVELTQTLAIPAVTAPKLVKRFGEDKEEDHVTGNHKPAAVKRFVERVLGQVVKGYFHEVSVKYRIEDFIKEQNEVRERLADRVDHALKAQGVKAGFTTISDINYESDEINKEFRKVAKLRVEILQLEQEFRSQGVKSDIHDAELERKKKDLGLAEQVLVDLFGREHRKMERVTEIRTKFPVPQVVVSGTDTPYLPLPMPALRTIAPSDRRPLDLTIEMADDDEDGAARTEGIETARYDDTRKHDDEPPAK